MESSDRNPNHLRAPRLKCWSIYSATRSIGVPGLPKWVGILRIVALGDGSRSGGSSACWLASMDIRSTGLGRFTTGLSLERSPRMAGMSSSTSRMTLLTSRV